MTNDQHNHIAFGSWIDQLDALAQRRWQVSILDVPTDYDFYAAWSTRTPIAIALNEMVTA